MTGSSFAAVVFDFDGLLMDTESTLVRAWQSEWAFHGLSLDLDDTFWPGHGGDVTQHRLDRLGALVGPGFDRAASYARWAFAPASRPGWSRLGRPA
jgi:putative hydrolase of the HAD superfamily